MLKFILSGLLVLGGPAFAASPETCLKPPPLKRVWLRGGAEVLAGLGSFAGGILLGHSSARYNAVRNIAEAVRENSTPYSHAIRLINRHLVPSLALALVEGAALFATLDGLVYLYSGGTRHLIGSITGRASAQTCQNLSDLHDALTRTAVQLEAL